MEVILHLMNEDPIVAEMETLPEATHLNIRVTNPRRRDGRALHYVTEGASSFIFPMSRVTFIEVMELEKAEEVVEFFRD